MSNFTGTLEMSGTAQKYIMFLPYSDKYQTMNLPVGIDTETDEYGNFLTTVEGNYSFVFDFSGSSTKNTWFLEPKPL